MKRREQLYVNMKRREQLLGAGRADRTVGVLGYFRYI